MQLRMKHLVLALALVVFVCVSAIYAQITAPVISEIRIRGNSFTEASFIRSQSGLFEGQRFIREEAGRVVQNLYKVGLFSDVQIYAEPLADDKLAIEIVVIEFPRLGDVVFEGNRAIKDKKLKRELGLIRGQLIKPQEKKRALNKVQTLYKTQGYLLAEAEVIENEPDADGRIPVTFLIREGKKVNLKKIRFHGNESFTNTRLRKQMKEVKQDGWWFGGGKFDEEKFPEDKELVLD